MPTDLTKVKDHPAAIIKAEVAELRLIEENHPGASGIDPGSVDYAARRLDKYEVLHGVTFAALDNDALADVRKAYLMSEFGGEVTPGYLVWVRALREAVSDLLRMEDS